MRLGDWFVFNNMARDNEHIRLWWDIKLGRFWYVVRWVRGSKPYAYRSTDATPPADDNEGRMLFGRYTD